MYLYVGMRVCICKHIMSAYVRPRECWCVCVCQCAYVIVFKRAAGSDTYSRTIAHILMSCGTQLSALYCMEVWIRGAVCVCVFACVCSKYRE